MLQKDTFIIQNEKIQTGEIRDVASITFTENLILQEWINKDKTLNAIFLLSVPKQDSDTYDMVINIGLIIATLQPDITKEERGQIVQQLIKIDPQKKDAENKYESKDFKYTFSLTKETGIIFTVSNKNEA